MSTGWFSWDKNRRIPDEQVEEEDSSDEEKDD